MSPPTRVRPPAGDRGAKSRLGGDDSGSVPTGADNDAAPGSASAEKFARFRQLYPAAARSSLYEWMRANDLAAVLYEAGLLDDWMRDRETGRRVKTIIRELGRLDYAGDEDMISAYLAARADPLWKVKVVVRALKRDVQTLDGAR